MHDMVSGLDCCAAAPRQADRRQLSDTVSSAVRSTTAAPSRSNRAPSHLLVTSQHSLTAQLLS
eukprot:5798-Heterococcus_DN1.PRE.1